MQVVTDKRYATNSGYIDEIEPENHKGKQKKAIGLTNYSRTKRTRIKAYC